MPNIPGLPEDLQSAPGFHMNPPPAEQISLITSMVEKAAATLKEGEKGRVVWIAQKVGNEKSVNGAIVSKVGGVQITGWLGKTWGTPTSAGLSTGVAGSFSF